MCLALRKALRAEEKERGRRRNKGKKSNPRVDQGDFKRKGRKKEENERRGKGKGRGREGKEGGKEKNPMSKEIGEKSTKENTNLKYSMRKRDDCMNCEGKREVKEEGRVALEYIRILV